MKLIVVRMREIRFDHSTLTINIRRNKISFQLKDRYIRKRNKEGLLEAIYSHYLRKYLHLGVGSNVSPEPQFQKNMCKYQNLRKG